LYTILTRMFKTKPQAYLRYLVPTSLFGTQRTKQILASNPIALERRIEPATVSICVYDYNAEGVHEHSLDRVEESFAYRNNQHVTWINIDGIRKQDVESLGAQFGIHQLIMEDILSINQRPKMDEVDDVLYCLLNMLYFNEKTNTVEQEQISIVLGAGFVITFQEDPARDVFNPIRDRLKMANTKLRQRGSDYLCYTMLDLIVDNYFFVMEKLSARIEEAEEEVVRHTKTLSLAHINSLRKELIVLKRNITPVRDLIGALIRSESELLEERTTKYFKDVHDHIIQAHDLSENYRDVMVSMQDLYINNVNLRMNEVMKVLAIVTCLLAPATVIGGIFGMNFDVIPTAHKEWGFYTAVGLMLFIPVVMLVMFKKRGWF
jgi:magnesium transporter